MTNRTTFLSSSQNGRETLRKATDKKSLAIDEMLKEVLNTIPASPLDGIGATPRNNEMDKKFNLADMHLPSKFKVSCQLISSLTCDLTSSELPLRQYHTGLSLPGPLSPPKPLTSNLKPPKDDSPPQPPPAQQQVPADPPT